MALFAIAYPLIPLFPSFRRFHLKSRYGKEKTIEICKTNKSSQKAFLRINQRKISPQEFIVLLGKNGINSYAVDNAVVVDNIAVSEIPGFPEGLFFVQDISAMKVAQFLKVEKSNAVLDMCNARR